MDKPGPISLIKELRLEWETRPRGGSDRERDAWDNGFRAAIEAMAACGVFAPLRRDTLGRAFARWFGIREDQ